MRRPEIREETGIGIQVVDILDAWMYHITVAAKEVFIVTYGCRATTDAVPVLSHEHDRIGEFTADEIADLAMPEGYKRSISTWFDRLHTASTIG